LVKDDDRVPCCAADAVRKVERLRLADGTEIGVIGLKAAIGHVLGMDLTEEDKVKEELLAHVKKSNYVSRSSEPAYKEALYEIYRLQREKG
jgi:hypothetical protein